MSREEAKRSKPEPGKSSGLNLPEPFQTSQGGLKPGHGLALRVIAFTLSPTGTTEGVGRDMAADPSVDWIDQALANFFCKRPGNK